MTPDELSVELSSRRTGMSFQRTRLSAERTLMSIIRTALSLIGFGFTIFQAFQKFHEAGVLQNSLAPRRFGESLVFTGIGMLLLGIVYHVRFMLGLRTERRQMRMSQLIHGESAYPVSLTLLTAIVVLVIGVVAIISMLTGSGPLG